MNEKIAIITGATGGIGTEFVRQLMGKEIDKIWAVARNEKKLAALKKQMSGQINEKAKGVSEIQIEGVIIDLSKEQELGKLRKKLEKEKPLVKYLVNNAGIAKFGSYEEFTEEEISTTIDINCKVPARLCQMCIPYMERGSRILNISSASSFQPTPYINLYAATKVFLRSYTRALNVELKDKGITATAVCPGWVDTELLPKELNGKKVKFPGIVTVKKVVADAMKDAEKGRDMSVCSLFVKCQHTNVKFLPQRLVMKIWGNWIRDYM